MQHAGSLAWVVFTMAIPLMIQKFYEKDKLEDSEAAFQEMESDFGIPANETFDFIIVGAGTAGCILARRLSEKYRVLLLEAGGEPPPVETITTLVAYTTFLPNIHWLMQSTTEKNAALNTGGKISTSAGKVLGGSGSHNDVQYERGSPFDFDNWAKFTGDSSWRYENVLKYFKRTENYKGKFVGKDENSQHGTEGLIDVVETELTFRDDLWFSAGQELGYDVGIDPNGPQKVGFATAEYNRNKGRRVSTFTAYVEPILGKRKTLTVRKYSLVSHIEIRNFQAVGVHYERHGVPRFAFASKEIILSAGAYISPVILMRSGIGPKDQLDLIKKKQLLDLPVGFNFQTHGTTYLDITVEDKSVFHLSANTVTFADFVQFKTQGTGYLAARGSLQEAFIPSWRAGALDGNPNWPDLLMYFVHKDLDNRDFFRCAFSLSRPRSSGRMLLNVSAVKLEDRLTPIIEHNLYSDKSDYDVMIHGVQMCQSIVGTTALQQIGAKLVTEKIPQCKDFAEDSRDYWICFFRYRTTGNVHASSTVRMGPKDDMKMSVLDSRFRVKGMKGLRVVDASVFPFIPNANLNGVVMMVAEKAAEEILSTWN